MSRMLYRRSSVGLVVVTLLALSTAAHASTITITDVPGGSPGGYLPLSTFGIAPIAGVTDDGVVNYNTPNFLYAGESWNRLGFASNGFLIVGGGTDGAFINQTLPDPTGPNNVLAPFWTDLDPTTGGALRIATLTNGAHSWIVADWQDVPLFGTDVRNSFQVWIGYNGFEDIWFLYGATGSPSSLTVGAEDKNGAFGTNYFVNGVGTRPGPTSQLHISTSATPVPEPETFALLALGLATVGATMWAGRTRRSGGRFA
jgi:hypothetical protein